jgi:multidrug efflux system membrane fusion protein
LPYNAILVPERCVASDQGQKYVVVVNKENTAEFQPVQLGTLFDTMQVVKSGVQVGETVVVDGLLKVRPGEKVDPKPADSGTPAPATQAAK